VKEWGKRRVSQREPKFANFTGRRQQRKKETHTRENNRYDACFRLPEEGNVKKGGSDHLRRAL